MLKVIQFGEGGFLRGFSDWMFQKINDKGLSDIEVTVVQPIATGFCDVLKEQGYKYTHLIRGAEGVEKTEVTCIKDSVNPYTDFEKA